MRLFSLIFMIFFSTSLAVSEEKIAYQQLENSPNKILLDNISSELMIVYKAPNEKHSIIVFTDVFCPYCRKLHQNLSAFLDNGISVRYVPFPLYNESKPVLESIWCAPEKDQQQLLDIAMLKGKFKAQSCEKTIIADAQKIARELKVYGTPSIFLEDGRKVSGFMTAEEINDGLEGRLNFDEWRPKHLQK